MRVRPRSLLRRRARAFSRVGGARAAAAVAEPALSRAARALAARAVALSVSSPGSSSSPAGASTPAMLVDARRSATRCSTLAAQCLSRAWRPGQRRARRSRSTSTSSRAHVGLRGARRRSSACGRRWAACRGWTSPPGTVALVAGDDRHGHVRRPRTRACCGSDVSARRGRSRWTALGIAALTASKIADDARPRCSACGLVGELLPARHRGRARSVGGGISRRAARGRRSSTRWCRSRPVYVAAHYLTFLGLRGPGDQLPGHRPASGRAGTCSARSTRRHRLLGLPAEGHRGTCRSPWSWSATSPRWRSRTTGR